MTPFLVVQRILEHNGVAFRTSVDASQELLPESSGEEEARSSERKRKRRERKRRKRKSKTHSSDSDSFEKSERSSRSDSDVETRHRKERRRKSAEELGEAGDSFERKGRESGGGAYGGTNGTDGTRTLADGTDETNGTRTLADADGVYLQTDGFGFRWSLVSGYPSFRSLKIPNEKLWNRFGAVEKVELRLRLCFPQTRRHKIQPNSCSSPQ